MQSPIRCRPAAANSTRADALECRDDPWSAFAPRNIWNAWAYTATSRDSIGSALRSGKVVAIRNALQPAVAEAIHAELLTIEDWNFEAQDNSSDIQYKRHLAACDVAKVRGLAATRAGLPMCPPVLSTIHRNLDRDMSFWRQFVLTDLVRWTPMVHHVRHGGGQGPFATWYQDGDFISPHNDVVGQRALSFVLSLTKQWDKALGGSFWWLSDTPHQFAPEFNTLVLFMPSPRSMHLVSPVTKTHGLYHPTGSVGRQRALKARRLAVSGWFEASNPTHSLLVAEHLRAPPSPYLITSGS